MTLASAQQFIQRAVNDTDLVYRINSAPDREAVRKILNELNLSFEPDEFEPAFLNVLTWCQTYEQVQAVKEIKTWWSLLMFALDEQTEEG